MLKLKKFDKRIKVGTWIQGRWSSEWLKVTRMHHTRWLLNARGIDRSLRTYNVRRFRNTQRRLS